MPATRKWKHIDLKSFFLPEKRGNYLHHVLEFAKTAPHQEYSLHNKKFSS